MQCTLLRTNKIVQTCGKTALQTFEHITYFNKRNSRQIRHLQLTKPFLVTTYMSNFGLAMGVDIGGHKLGVFKKETTLIDHNAV